GIRDLYVTGVQTCALPISVDCLERGQLRSYLWAGAWAGLACVTKWPMVLVASTFVCVGLVRIARRETDARRELAYIVAGLACAEIGRASCRERVQLWGGVV